MGLKATTNPQTATANWGKKVAAAGATWSAGYLAAAPNVFNPANIKPDRWQQGVSNPNAMNKYAKNMAAVNMQQLTAVVNSSGQSKFTTSGTNKQAKMLAFQSAFLPVLSNVLQSLNQSNPRGPRGSAENKARSNMYFDMLTAKQGQF